MPSLPFLFCFVDMDIIMHSFNMPPDIVAIAVRTTYTANKVTTNNGIILVS